MVDFATMRAAMVDSQVRTLGVTDPEVIEAFRAIPRERFVPSRRRALAYMEGDFEVRAPEGGAPSRALMAPHVFARLVQAAEITPDALILDIGCASGYSAAVLARLANSIVALEQDEDLAEAAEEALVSLGIGNVAVVRGPFAAGYAEEGPYDVILLEGSVDAVPQTLFAQLKEGGRLLGVVGRGLSAAATLFVRSGDEIGARPLFNAAITPLPGFTPLATFTF